MTDPPGDMTETPNRGGRIGSGWRRPVARRAAMNHREELARSKATQSGFCGHPPDLSVSRQISGYSEFLR
jgi:hypothetical protein